MASIQNGPVRPPLKPAPQPNGSGKVVLNSGGVKIEQERTGSTHPADSPHTKPATAGNAARYARRRLPTKKAPPSKPISDALAAAKEKATGMGHEIREQFGQSLTREDYIRVARVFRSAILPKRKPGRRPKAQVTAAYQDWKAGVRGVALFRKHIPGWEKHGEWRRKAEDRALMDAIRSRRRRESDRLPALQSRQLINRRHDAA